MRQVKYKINLQPEQKETLEKLLKKQSTPQNIARRAKIILLTNNAKESYTSIASTLGIGSCDITKWTKRWIERSDIKDNLERLQDNPRSGRPSGITPEQWCQIMALACEKPENHGVPLTNWSHSTLTREIIKQGIVETISQSHVGDFLKKQNYNHTEVSIG
ncbi:MAG: helix-turn-helix domain-containing protein [Sulfurimonas sp.]|nr:helix-turn-helix domain-containing protein [Sulfurimonas sp.]MDQ7060807.1 helix-turn-helix domain-containing protein [Sulfurimonas sp.]